MTRHGDGKLRVALLFHLNPDNSRRARRQLGCSSPFLGRRRQRDTTPVALHPILAALPHMDTDFLVNQSLQNGTYGESALKKSEAQRPPVMYSVHVLTKPIPGVACLASSSPFFVPMYKALPFIPIHSSSFHSIGHNTCNLRIPKAGNLKLALGFLLIESPANELRG